MIDFDAFLGLSKGETAINNTKNKRIRPGITEVAIAAQVSTATVDRVLNKRGGVRQATINRVLMAAAELGYVHDQQLTGETRKSPLTLRFLLPTGTNPYLKHLAGLIRSGNGMEPHLNIKCSCHPVTGFDPAALAEAIRESSNKADGIALMGLEHPLVREAINEATGNGTPVITIISDVSRCERVAYVGLDNRAVGRTAAYLLARFCGPGSGAVGLIAGSLSYLAHNEREMGFLALMQESFPHFRVIGVREGHDDFDENYQLTKSLLAQHADLVGLYNIGGSSDGVAAALREAGRTRDLVFIGHGLSEDTRTMLIDGTIDVVIHQDPLAMVHNVCQIFANIKSSFPTIEKVPELAMRIICRENMP